METFESNDFGETPENIQENPTPSEPLEDEAYRNAGAGRKESPFADSPYVMNHGGGYSDVPPAQHKAPKAKKKGSGKVWKAVVAAVLAVVLVAGGCGITAFCVNSYWEDQTQKMTDSLNRKIADLEKQVEAAGNTGVSVSGSPVSSVDGGLTPSQVYAQNVSAVVAVSNQTTTNFYGQVSETASSGSGFILTENGYVVTNYHVVEGATTLTVITSDSTEYPAELVGYDSTNDIAVLKIEATGLPHVTLGSSDDLIVGDQVVAIGNPLGELTSTLTVGFVSALNRDVSTDNSTVINMLQTDAAINPGNSGGPLFNMKGEVVGITTAKYSGTTSSGASIEGIGFAIPIDDVLSLIDDLVNYGYVTGAYLGIMVRNTDSSVQMYGLPMGALVDSVSAGSCAEAAGLQSKDIIVALGDNAVENVTDLTRALRKFKAGDTTTLTVFRSGREMTLTVTLDEKPHETTTQTPAPSGEESSLPSDGNYEEWYNYFFGPFFGQGKG